MEGPSLRPRRKRTCVMLAFDHSQEDPPSQRLTLPFTLSHLPWAHPWGRVAGPQGSSSGTAPRVSSPEPNSLWPWVPGVALLLFPASQAQPKSSRGSTLTFILWRESLGITVSFQKALCRLQTQEPLGRAPFHSTYQKQFSPESLATHIGFLF